MGQALKNKKRKTIIFILGFFFLFFIVVTLLGLYIWRLPNQGIPYPYLFSDTVAHKYQREYSLEIKDQFPHVLFIGDRMGKSLKRFESILSEELSKNLQDPPQITNMSAEHEGLHRSLFRIKQIDRLPKIIVYHGGSEELFEKKFFIKQEQLILNNFRKYYNDKFQTMLLVAPFLAKFLYDKVLRVFLDNIEEDKYSYPDAVKLKQVYIGYKIFEIELEELIKTVTAKNSHLILMTAPLNLEVFPKKVCQGSTFNEVILLQDRIFSLIQSQDFKSSYNELLELKKVAPGNALTEFLLGQTLKNLGDIDKARIQLELASSLDCSTWRATAVHNAIIRKLSEKYEIALFDFDYYLNSQLGSNVLFLDEIYPQDYFYEQANLILARQIKKFLGI